MTTNASKWNVSSRRRSKSNDGGGDKREKGLMREDSNCKIEWKNEREEGRKGRPWCCVFCPVTSWGAPWEPWERWAASRPLLWFHALMLFALSGANCFSVPQNTRPLLFIMMILIVQQPGARYGIAKPLPVWYFYALSLFLSFSPLLLWSYFISSPPLPSDLLPFCVSLPNIPSVSLSLSLWGPHFFSFFSPLHSCSSLLLCACFSIICLSFLFAPLSSAPVHWAACNHICTTSCQFDRIHASVFCHLRRKRDWSPLSYLSHISVGRISIKSIWK